LFQHQRRAAREVHEKIQGHIRRVVLHMPTGAGKTRTAMNVVVEHLRMKEPTLVVWLAHTEELCEQASHEFEHAWSALGNRTLSLYRFWGDHEFNPQTIRDGFVVAGLAKLYSATKQTIQVASVLGSRSSLVVIDEAHIAIADTYKLIIEALVVHHSGTALLGLTATPGRTWSDIEADRKLASFFSRQKVELTIEGYTNPVDYLIAEGYLAQAIFKPLMHEGGLELTAEDYRRIEAEFDIPASVMLKLADDEQRNLVIIREIEELSKQHERIIVFATTVEHANLIATILRARGHNAASVTGQTPETERVRRIEEYKSADPETRILCNYGVLTTGFDAPRTSAAVIARPTKSLVLYSQMVGRAIRGVRAGGNKSAVIVTVVDQDLPGFNSVADAFTNWEDIWE
jgi:DNA repair protein RadD